MCHRRSEVLTRYIITTLLVGVLIFGQAFGQSNSPAPTVSSPSLSSVSATAETPGPSAALFGAPFYSCQRNYFVATTGDDSGDGSQAKPWKTIQHADSASRLPGDCINVAAGTYAADIVIRNGGNEPTSTGYVTYRCQILNQCHVLAPAAGHLWLIESPANFIVVDGFEIDGNGTIAQPDGMADQCIGSSWANSHFNRAPNNDSSHHVWVLNSIVHHCNLAGISFSDKEWIYVIHNKVYHNSWTSGYEGSGIAFVVFRCIELDDSACSNTTGGSSGSGSYKPSGMDLTYMAPFHAVVSMNVVFDNSEAHSPIKCGSHTDGNGIIIDTFLAEPDNKITYPYRSLVYGNLAYANGGRGIHVFASSNVSVAYNTAYGNGLDTCNNSYYLGDLSQAGGANNVWVNNIAESVLTVANPTCGTTCGGRNAPLVAGNGKGVVDANNTYSNNILYGGVGPQMFDADVRYFSVANNKIMSPLLAGPTTGNFALQPMSPAVGYAQSDLPLAPADAGACSKTLIVCPSSPLAGAAGRNQKSQVSK
jgi:parallel beta-helix repeat protein